MLAGLTGGLLIGYPVAFTLGGIGMLFAALGTAVGAFDASYLHALPSRLFGILTNEALVSVPYFILMGMVLERSGIATDLIISMGQLLSRLRGGLGVAIILVGTMLAACTGVVGATIVTLGLITLPTLLKAGYDKRLISGIVCCSGTLGTLIPPSVVLIFLAVILEASYTQTQMAMGNFAPRPLSVGDLFAGALFPGLLLSGLYIVFMLVVAFVRPSACPPIKTAARPEPAAGFRLAVAIIPALFLIVAVLGSILIGLATPTESASVGAIGALLLAAVKIALFGRVVEAQPGADVARMLLLFWTAVLLALLAAGLAYGALGVLSIISVLAACALLIALMRHAAGLFEIVHAAVDSAVKLTVMVFLIFFGATLFSLVFARLGGDVLVKDVLTGLPGGAFGAMLAVMAVIFVLGFFLDTFEIIFIVVPLTAPALFALQIDPVWLGVMMAVNLQTSFMTPPFGFSLFYFKSVAAEHISTLDIYKGVAPFVAIQLLCLSLVWVFPLLATWLPTRIFG
ncbi:MAG: TRAP transporter large permease subunit [Hyphomicrobiaceae bacterium]|nr:TRAP transporter large permease subunit [Hyphomicrobiaceae bacterium]